MTRDEILEALYATGQQADQAEDLGELCFLADAANAYRTAYLLLTEQAHLLPAQPA